MGGKLGREKISIEGIQNLIKETWGTMKYFFRCVAAIYVSLFLIFCN